MKLIINTESAAAKAIMAMIHSAGTSEIYINTVSRLYNCVLHNQDDLGMDDTEAIDTLRTLDLLRSDIRDIAADKDLKAALRHAKDTEADRPDVLIMHCDFTDIMPDWDIDPVNRVANGLSYTMQALAGLIDQNPQFKEIAEMIDSISGRFKEIITTKTAE